MTNSRHRWCGRTLGVSGLIAGWVMNGNLMAADPGYGPSDAAGRSGWGAFVVPVPLSVQAQRDLEPGQGALVLGVRPGGTADKLGLQRGDVVLSVNEAPIETRRDVRNAIGTSAPGDQIAVQVMNGSGAVRDLTGTIVARQPRPPGARPPGGPPDGNQGPGRPGGNPGWMDPSEVVARQYEELLKERDALRDAKADLAAAQAALPQIPDTPWIAQGSAAFTTRSTTPVIQEPKP